MALQDITASGIVRVGLGGATLAFAALGVLTGDTRFYLASGLTGTFWWLWDWVADAVLAPLGDMLENLFLGGGVGIPLPPESGSTGEDAIRRLEARLEHPGSPDEEVQAALRLADLYRVVRD